VISDWFFRIPAIRVAEARAAAGAPGTWMYRFDRPEPQDNHRLGACHGAEIPFVFDTVTLDECAPALGDTPVAGRRGPGPPGVGRLHYPGRPGLGAYDTASRTTALLSETTDATDDPAGDERARWDGIR
jgi:para-nitrobenzyl esterase